MYFISSQEGKKQETSGSGTWIINCKRFTEALGGNVELKKGSAAVQNLLSPFR
jgi:hypothetical protein